MPNILAHAGVQGVLTRALLPKADIKIVFLGCLLPDVPWIFIRIVQGLSIGVDPYYLRLYAIAQATFFVTMFLCGALAVLSTHPKQVFGVLSLNAFFHLLLDSLQTKWANGVHFFAPASWQMVNFQIFWPESLPTYILTIFGLAYLCWVWSRAVEESWMLSRISKRQIMYSVGLLTIYGVLPLVLLSGALRENNHYVKTLHDKQGRTGHTVEFDRVPYENGNHGHTLETFANEKIQIANPPLEYSAQVSVRGRFLTPQSVEVIELHEHLWWFRDGTSYIGILLLFSMWGVGWFRAPKARGPNET